MLVWVTSGPAWVRRLALAPRKRIRKRDAEVHRRVSHGASTCEDRVGRGEEGRDGSCLLSAQYLGLWLLGGDPSRGKLRRGLRLFFFLRGLTPAMWLGVAVTRLPRYLQPRLSHATSSGFWRSRLPSRQISAHLLAEGGGPLRGEDTQLTLNRRRLPLALWIPSSGPVLLTTDGCSRGTVGTLV